MIANNLLLWTDDLSVSTQEVDEQHKGLIDQLNLLHAAIIGNHGVDTTREIFDQLTESIRVHFLFEESLMRLTHYAGYAAHKEQHESLMDLTRLLQGKLDAGAATITTEHLHFQKDWWITHIRSSDRHFSTHYETSELAHLPGKTAPALLKKPGWWKFW